ncbi:MAG: hypothetical protein IPH95_10680 [Candidatus Promineofilum sp.]|nr:hypothetical protein [Promineifilum sp.]
MARGARRLAALLLVALATLNACAGANAEPPAVAIVPVTVIVTVVASLTPMPTSSPTAGSAGGRDGYADEPGFHRADAYRCERAADAHISRAPQPATNRRRRTNDGNRHPDIGYRHYTHASHYNV